MFYRYYFDPTYFLILIGALIMMMAQFHVQSSYRKYSRIKNSDNMSGYEVARMIAYRHHLDVTFEMVSGTMSDHYDPRSHVVRLSKEVYEGRSIASICIAAHEMGHALQHQEGYSPLIIRNNIIPLVNIGSNVGWFAIMFGLIFSNYKVAMFGFLGLSLMLLFQLLTLPVEFNASSRAITLLKDYDIIYDDELSMAKKMLGAAALTYVASVASTILSLLRTLLIILNTRDE